MIRTNPFAWLVESAQARIFIALVVLTLVLGGSLQILGGPLATAEAPSGLVSFEFAGTQENAQKILASWGWEGQVRAALIQGLDYLFIFAYAGCISLGCVLLSRSLSQSAGTYAAVGMLLAWALIGAGLLDAIENLALIRILLDCQKEIWPALARWCAIPKFLIVAAGLGYLLLGAVLKIGRRGQR